MQKVWLFSHVAITVTKQFAGGIDNFHMLPVDNDKFHSLVAITSSSKMSINLVLEAI